ncbi:MAG: hypothetical protein M1817_002321 [Caeruleum heppii]|nr:MAG: hypothetical protein M1817_002321 [Caeruleum heppii]
MFNQAASHGIGAGGSASPRPLHFVCRENGAMVPLIAVDDLPEGVRIAGVSKTMWNINETVGMTNLGIFPANRHHYIVEGSLVSGEPEEHVTTQQSHDSSSSTPTTSYRAPDALVRPESNKGVLAWRKAGPHVSQREPKPFVAGEILPGTMMGSPKSRRPSLASHLAPPSEKTYCTHWVFHGECAFIHSPSGCRFKHEMPTDPETMASVGLKTLPKWWTSKQAMQELEIRTAAMQTSAATTDPLGPTLQPVRAFTPSMDYLASRSSNSQQRPSNNAQKPVPFRLGGNSRSFASAVAAPKMTETPRRQPLMPSTATSTPVSNASRDRLHIGEEYVQMRAPERRAVVQNDAVASLPAMSSVSREGSWIEEPTDAQHPGAQHRPPLRSGALHKRRSPPGRSRVPRGGTRITEVEDGSSHHHQSDGAGDTVDELQTQVSVSTGETCHSDSSRSKGRRSNGSSKSRVLMASQAVHSPVTRTSPVESVGSEAEVAESCCPIDDEAYW